MQHPALQKLFKADGSYVRPAEDPVTVWAIIKLAEEYKAPLDAIMSASPSARYAMLTSGQHTVMYRCLPSGAKAQRVYAWDSV